MSNNSSKSRKKCLEKAAFHETKKIFLFSLMSFVLAIFAARTFTALQLAGFITSSPNVIGSFHFHHWAFSLIGLMIIVPLMFVYREKKDIFGFLVIVSFFFLGLFVDGIIYSDSANFFNT